MTQKFSPVIWNISENVSPGIYWLLYSHWFQFCILRCSETSDSLCQHLCYSCGGRHSQSQQGWHMPQHLYCLQWADESILLFVRYCLLSLKSYRLILLINSTVGKLNKILIFLQFLALSFTFFFFNYCKKELAVIAMNVFVNSQSTFELIIQSLPNLIEK